MFAATPDRTTEQMIARATNFFRERTCHAVGSFVKPPCPTTFPNEEIVVGLFVTTPKRDLKRAKILPGCVN